MREDHAMPLTRGARRFYELLLRLNVDEAITRQRILDATKWTSSSLETYVNKNKLSPFLLPLPDGRFRVVRAGPALNEQEVDRALTQVSPSTLVLAEGQEFRALRGNYRLTREIGRGAVGHVWEARHTKSGELVAIKVLNPRPDLLEPTRISNVRRRFRREIKNGAELRHPHVVEHLDHGEFSGEPFLVMERAVRSWGDVLDTEGPVDPTRAAGILRHALEGLAHIHAQNCVHRDIKPDNLLITRRGATVVADLGIVGWSDLNPEFTSAGTITRSSMQLGSWHYMAPEQLAAPHEVTAASDVYALGVTWFELLKRDVLTPQHFVAGKVPRIPEWPSARDWILKMTTFDPSERPTIVTLLEVVSKS
jgi:serine/threonine protein kinase